MEKRPDFFEPSYSHGDFLNKNAPASHTTKVPADSTRNPVDEVNLIQGHDNHTAFQEQKLGKADAQFKELTYNYLKLKDLLTDMEERVMSKESVIADLRAAHESTKERYREMEIRALEAEAKVEKLTNSLAQFTSQMGSEHSHPERAEVSNASRPLWESSKGETGGSQIPPQQKIIPETINTSAYKTSGIHPPEQHNRHLLNNNANRSNWGKIELHHLPKFDGTNKLVTEWVAEVELLGCMFNIPKEDMVMALQIMLTGPAKDWLLAEAKNIMAIHGHNWMAWKEAIKDRFHDEEKRNAVIIEYQTLNFKHFKSIKAYMTKKFYLRSKAYGDDIPRDQSESNLVAQTLLLFPSTARMALRATWIDKCLSMGNDIRTSSMSWTQLLRAVEDLLSSSAAIQQYDPCVIAANMSSRGESLNLSTEKTPEPFNSRCRNCGMNDHATTDCSAAKDKKLYCEICKKSNHSTEMHRNNGGTKHFENKTVWKQKPQVSFVAQFDPENDTDDDDEEHHSDHSSNADVQDFQLPVQ